MSCTDTSLHDRDISQRVQKWKSTVLALGTVARTYTMLLLWLTLEGVYNKVYIADFDRPQLADEDSCGL